MALQNHPGIYTGGTVVFDSTPTVNLYAQLQEQKQAKERAKQEAFDEYIRGLNTKINPAGKRNVDDPAFQYKLNKWQQFGMEHKDKLQKGDIAAQTEFGNLYQEIQNLLSESKQAEESKRPLVEILTDPNKRSKLSERVFGSISSHDEPLYIQDKSGEFIRNPNRKNINYADNMFNPQFDFLKNFEGLTKGMERGKTIGEVLRSDPKSGQVIRAFEETFSPEQLNQIGINAGREAIDNPEAADYYEAKFKDLSEADFEKANKAYQSVFGKQSGDSTSGKTSVNIVDSPQKLAAAEAIIQARGMAKKGEEAVLDRELANQRAINKIYISQAGRGSDKPSVTLADYDRFKDYEPKYETKTITVSKPNWLGKGGETKEVTIIKANDVDIADKKLMGDATPYFDNGQKYYIVRPDGDWEGMGGQVISRANVARKNMDATAINEVDRGRLSDNIVPRNNPNPQPSGSISINDVPAGTKLEQKNGKYYYKGKEVKM
jgi:hypothetical protein